MSTRKANPSSVLKTLPEDRQHSIADYARTHTLAETVAWLRADGLKTDTSSLSRFLSWHSAEQLRIQREEKIQHWLECEKLEHPELTDEELDRRGQRKFKMLSIAEEDTESWVQLKRGDRDEKQLAQDWVKIMRESDEFFAAMLKKAEELNASNLSQEEKIAAMRQAAFKDVEVLKQSGALQIPK